MAIVEQALLRNTLVCLPTGLGKTFIAAVVMYNFFRWFPQVCLCPLIWKLVANCTTYNPCLSSHRCNYWRIC